MDLYPKMYAILCGAASEVVDLIEAGRPQQAAAMLRRALEEAEELYLAAGEDLTS